MWEIAPIVGYSDLLPISLAVRSEGQVFDFYVKRSITCPRDLARNSKDNRVEIIVLFIFFVFSF